MDSGYVTKAEHDEFVKRIESEHKRLEDEDKRQNNRLLVIEEKIDDLVDLTTSIKSLTVEIQSMTKEIEKMGKRIEALEGRDGEMWRKVIGGCGHGYRDGSRHIRYVPGRTVR